MCIYLCARTFACKSVYESHTYMHINTYTHTFSHTHIYSHTISHKHTHIKHTQIYSHTNTRTQVHTHKHTHSSTPLLIHLHTNECRQYIKFICMLSSLSTQLKCIIHITLLASITNRGIEGVRIRSPCLKCI